MRDLAPTIHRQRLVIEGIPGMTITSEEIVAYLAQLSSVLGMQALMQPLAHLSPKFGWAGWIHWETSGAHLYAWDDPMLFFSVDIYTCKAFQDGDAVRYTRDFFNADTVVHRSF